MKGLTLIDVLIGTALMLIVFLGIFGGFQLALKAINQNQLKTIALALATQEMEKIKSLSYVDITAKLSYVDISYVDVTEKPLAERGQYFTVKTIVNEIDGNYKKVKVEVYWGEEEEGEVALVTLVTDIAP